MSHVARDNLYGTRGTGLRTTQIVCLKSPNSNQCYILGALPYCAASVFCDCPDSVTTASCGQLVIAVCAITTLLSEGYLASQSQTRASQRRYFAMPNSAAIIPSAKHCASK